MMTNGVVGIEKFLKLSNMPNEKNNRDEYPKPDDKDKRWKQQDEFDSAGAQRQQEDEDKNASIPNQDSVDKEPRGKNV